MTVKMRKEASQHFRKANNNSEILEIKFPFLKHPNRSGTDQTVVSCTALKRPHNNLVGIKCALRRAGCFTDVAAPTCT